MKKALIYKVTTECKLNAYGLWIYSAKIYYRYKSTRSVKTVTASSYPDLLDYVRKIGKELLKEYQQE